jgi:hypothetical protein
LQTNAFRPKGMLLLRQGLRQSICRHICRPYPLDGDDPGSDYFA